jgi:hypothetical protein
MNFEQVVSIVRQAMLFLGGYLVTKGWTDNGTLQTIVGAIITLGSSGWAIYTRRNTGLIASAANVPSVQQITTTSETAQSLPSPKVVSP